MSPVLKSGHENKPPRIARGGPAPENTMKTPIVSSLAVGAFHAGWPSAITAVSAARDVFKKE